MNKLKSRTFWTVGKEKMCGYIESVGNGGLFFKHDQIKFKNTSSNLSRGEISYLSLYNSKIKKERLIDLMNRRKPINISITQQFFCAPWKNNILGGMYLCDVKEIKEEKINVIPVKD